MLNYYPLEMHIVHKITDLPACAAAGGCFSVTGVLFELADGGDNPLLKAIWAAMPMREGVSLKR
ncbi:Carbonic anhydrase 2 [Pleodorina starrii]|nr:Carbonic anhydrase 2 [Pleodorina starrii]